MDLISTLTQQLNLSEGQAEGGVGLLLKMASDRLGGGDFAEVKDSIPNAETYMNKAPEAGGGLMGALGGLASSFGGGMGDMGELAKLASGFSSLDINTDTIKQFVPIVLEFMQSNGTAKMQEIIPKLISQFNL